MIVTYCRAWNFLTGGPIDELTAEQARAYDGSGEPYAVALGDPASPDQVLEITRPDYIGVWFFDARGRQSLNYAFGDAGGGTLFLESMIRYEYPDDRARLLLDASRVEEVTYDPGGVAHHAITDTVTGETKETDYRDVNQDINTEPVPAFGEWTSIARHDRTLPA